MSASRPKPGSSGWKKSKIRADPAKICSLAGLAFTRRSLYGGAEFGDRIVSRISNSVSKLAVTALIVAACALGGCGRKGGLDLPPGAGAQAAPDSAQSNPDSQYSPAGAATSQGNVFEATPGQDPLRAAPKGPKKRIILDPILD
ncbi:MAG: lipoprotein [Xanthobacteraceae bacterium]|nr:lipoprotein [Xanthobacteraceae bacterium]